MDLFMRRYGRELDPNSAHDFLALISIDSERVWWADLEDDVFLGENAYVGLFAEWAGISRGAFHPAAVEETWGPYQAPPIRITFRVGDQVYRARAAMEE